MNGESKMAFKYALSHINEQISELQQTLETAHHTPDQEALIVSRVKHLIGDYTYLKSFLDRTTY